MATVQLARSDEQVLSLFSPAVLLLSATRLSVALARFFSLLASICLYCFLRYSVRILMNYSELLETGASPTEIQSYLRDSELVSVTIRIPRTLRDSAKEVASLRGMNSTSFIKGLVIEELSRRD